MKRIPIEFAVVVALIVLAIWVAVLFFGKSASNEFPACPSSANGAHCL